MVAERRFIDLENDGRLDEVVREAERARTPVELRRDGKVVALVGPSEPTIRDDPPEGSVEAILNHAGGLNDAFTDEIVEQRRAQRQVPSRTFDWE